MDLITLAQGAVEMHTDPWERIVDRLVTSDMFGWSVFFAFVLAISIVSKTASTIKAIARERTRREIAAFIAEGSITPEQGERLMKAGQSSGHC